MISIIFILYLILEKRLDIGMRCFFKENASIVNQIEFTNNYAFKLFPGSLSVISIDSTKITTAGNASVT